MPSKSKSTFTAGGALRLLLEFLYPLYGIASTPERRRYWRDLPLRRAIKPFAAVFFILGGIPFFVDIFASTSFPLGILLAYAVASGALHVMVIICELRRPRLMVLPMVAIAALYLSFAVLPKVVQDAAARERRIVFDASCLLVPMLLGYRLFLNFTNNEGIQHVQLETELALAHRLQQTLVPPFSYCGMGLEMYGRTIPSAAVGGDLVDLVVAPGSVFAYLADVSGHGIPAGVLMGMVKSSVRQGVLADFSLPAMLDSVNAVLPAVKEPDMFVTLGAVRFDGSTAVEYSLAGHPALLHYCASALGVIRRSMIQYPLGLMAEGDYRSEFVTCGSGDLLMLVTDGLIETLSKTQEEFGLQRLEHLLVQNADRPLPEIFDALIAAVSAFGPQQDDRTVLLVRVLSSTQPALEPSESTALPVGVS
jgi:sigma-B regulation protein RsbU (phosphoserine phosphatase)